MSIKLKVVAVSLLALLTLAPRAVAQSAEAKINVAGAAATIFNPSFEIGFSKASAITFDYVGAFAKEDFLGTGYPLIVSSAIWGYRRYGLRSDHQGFFYGADFGLHSFRMNKNIIPIVANDSSADKYDVGQGYLLGFTLGYKLPLAKRFNIEMSLSGGWHCSNHEGYNGEGVRLFELNPSAEWLPYKAGIYLTYNFW